MNFFLNDMYLSFLYGYKSFVNNCEEIIFEDMDVD